MRATSRTSGAAARRSGAAARQPSEGVFGRGYYVEPVLAEADPSDPLWKQEMFLPILMVQRYRDRDAAMRLANDTDMGLTAGFYGAPDEIPWFQDGIQAGVTYANRGAGATTGAWPGYQPFGGWKGSGSSGKAIASVVLPAALHARAVADRGGVNERVPAARGCDREARQRRRLPRARGLHAPDPVCGRP